jgi:hypothetical protein
MNGFFLLSERSRVKSMELPVDEVLKASRTESGIGFGS